jgi:hypothetical protein
MMQCNLYLIAISQYQFIFSFEIHCCAVQSLRYLHNICYAHLSGNAECAYIAKVQFPLRIAFLLEVQFFSCQELILSNVLAVQRK